MTLQPWPPRSPARPAPPWQLRHLAPAIEQVHHGQQRMAPHHARSGVSHHLPDPVALLVPVAVHRTFRTGGLAVTIGTAVQPAMRVLPELAALGAQTDPALRPVMVAAVDPQHGVHRTPFAFEAIEEGHGLSVVPHQAINLDLGQIAQSRSSLTCPARPRSLALRGTKAENTARLDGQRRNRPSWSCALLRRTG